MLWGLVVSIYQSFITVVNLEKCLIGDIGYQQLAFGLEACTRLEEFYLQFNDLTDVHAEHIGNVIGNNHTTLKGLITSQNNFSTAGQIELHGHTPQCRDLEGVSVGGTQITDMPNNMHLVCTIINGCRNLTGLYLFEVRLADSDQSHLLRVLSRRKIYRLGLVNTGLSVQCTQEMNQFLHERRHNLYYLDISENPLCDTFLLEVHHALSQCIALKQLYLYSSQLTSLSFLVLASLIRQLPRLSHLRLYGNDFRENDQSFDEFMQAVTQHDVWQVFYVPVPELIHPRLLDFSGCGTRCRCTCAVCKLFAHEGMGGRATPRR